METGHSKRGERNWLVSKGCDPEERIVMESKLVRTEGTPGDVQLQTSEHGSTQL